MSYNNNTETCEKKLKCVNIVMRQNKLKLRATIPNC